MTNRIGLFGFGVVGQGYYEIAKNDRPSLLPETIVVQNKNKERPHSLQLSFDPKDILNTPHDIGIELISDPIQAYDYVSSLLKSGKKVISANKKMLAAHLPELLELEKSYGGSLLYEASAAAGIPIITCLDCHFAGDHISKLQGILNGSSNYILSRLFQDDLSLSDAVKLAQEKGFAEADPTLDINGSDVSSKLTILSLHAFGRYIPENEILTIGVQHVHAEDVALAKSLGLKIKLIATVQRSQDGLSMYILPALVGESDPLFLVENEYNAAKVTSHNLGEQFFQGKGAGSLPTGASVYADLTKAIKGYAYSYDKLQGAKIKREKPLTASLEVIVSADTADALAPLIGQATIHQAQERYWSICTLATEDLIKHLPAIEANNVSIIALNGSVRQERILDSIQKLENVHLG
ncbi:homoserine dehydrogenase [Echinicola vietnamensis]|uniref:Homoserine dehydrogenase n=1 Tax=Echinicola vietnamensis (strain DSM 17526 / LMG 23754 / KMM 6221) TaxID=926556 RepID=L0G2I6_ECHVK|nr:homoserine dehydrogenase [Echinicola vietnamensis]AGA79508.1 homoserine dehydrogenase [Echinicola vietnamensis DSM 17526]